MMPHGVDPAFTPGGDGAGGRTCCSWARSRRGRTRSPPPTRPPRSGCRSSSSAPRRSRSWRASSSAAAPTSAATSRRAALAELYRGAAALVLPSRYEGFGLPVLEAMASGTPVVAAPDPALQEVAGDAALYADRGELADALRRALDEPAPLAAAGLERARRFSWADAARRTVDVYLEALA